MFCGLVALEMDGLGRSVSRIVWVVGLMKKVCRFEMVWRQMDVVWDTQDWFCMMCSDVIQNVF